MHKTAGYKPRRQVISKPSTASIQRPRNDFCPTCVNAGIGIAIVHLDGRFLEVNRAFEFMSGRKEHELLSLKLSDVLVSESQNDTSGLMSQFRIHQGPHHHVYARMIRADADPLVCLLTASLSQQTPEDSLLLIVEDATASLKVSELSKRYEFLFEYARDIILFVEDTGHISEANRAAEKTYGFTRSELLTMSISDLRAPNTVDDVSAQMNTAGLQGIVFETWHSRKDGSVFPVEVSSRGQMLGGKMVLLSIIRDITERKRIEHNLTRRNTELSMALDKLKLAQVQLLQQDKLAAIGQLAAGVAHEINNPLAYIDSNMHSLERHVTTMQHVLSAYRKVEGFDISQSHSHSDIDYILEDMPKIFAECHEGIERVSKIVKGLKLFSRIDSLREIDDYDLNLGIRTTLLVARNELKYAADVIEHLGNIPTIKANGGQINQVILNMLLNSAQAITEANRGDGGIIEIVTTSDREFVYIEISDNGNGISPEHYSKIFDPFFTTKPPGKGTGLGLSISYDIIVNKHKGEISVVSSPSVGTTFKIKLPIGLVPSH